jgi:cysteate synthase
MPIGEPMVARARPPRVTPAAFSPTPTWLRCLGCGAEFVDDEQRLACDAPHPPALLRSLYRTRRPAPRDDEPGVFRWRDWLPVRARVEHAGAPAVYRSEGLARALGLSSLWIAFSGWWPERGATLATATFKELEAPVVCARLGEDPRTLVVASAGNTARAFIEVCGRTGRRLVVVVPARALPDLWCPSPLADHVRVVAVEDGDYADAIAAAGLIAALDGFVAEGGARNVARRDALGTPVLAAAHAIGRVPDHYVQAVGSGSGGIAAHEAALRLGRRVMRLHLAQNLPFAPMVEAHARGAWPELSDDDARRRIAAISAAVLANRTPPWAVTGGVRDALAATGGEMYGVENDEARDAAGLVEVEEGIDLEPAAAVAVAALRQAVAGGRIAPADTVLLHLTGGGRARLLAGRRVHAVSPTHVIHARRDLQNQIWERFAPNGGI